MVETTRLRSIDDELVREIRRRIVEAFEPDGLWLFGSAARQQARGGSDLVLMVVESLYEPAEVLAPYAVQIRYPFVSDPPTNEEAEAALRAARAIGGGSAEGSRVGAVRAQTDRHGAQRSTEIYERGAGLTRRPGPLAGMDHSHRDPSMTLKRMDNPSSGSPEHMVASTASR